MCIADLGDLTVINNLNVVDKADDAGVNKTVKPTAFMSLYRNGENVNGGTVKLTDVITMVLQLDEEYIQDFDIKAKSCFADTIEIIQYACPIDTELFPAVSQVSQGILNAEFGAFRTTSLAGGSVGMPFSCTLQVCLGSCAPATCSDGVNTFNSHGRKKRSVVKRQAEDNAVEDISVGGTISVSTEELTIETPGTDDRLCMAHALFFAIILPLSGAALCATSMCVILYRKMKRRLDVVNKLSAGKM